MKCARLTFMPTLHIFLIYLLIADIVMCPEWSLIILLLTNVMSWFPWFIHSLWIFGTVKMKIPEQMNLVSSAAKLNWRETKVCKGCTALQVNPVSGPQPPTQPTHLFSISAEKYWVMNSNSWIIKPVLAPMIEKFTKFNL